MNLKDAAEVYKVGTRYVYKKDHPYTVGMNDAYNTTVPLSVMPDYATFPIAATSSAGALAFYPAPMTATATVTYVGAQLAPQQPFTLYPPVYARAKDYRIGIDVDGVMANFVRGYCGLSQELCGKTLTEEAYRWDWWDKTLSKDENTKIWDYIIANPEWWDSLEPLDDTDFAAIIKWRASGATVYAITTRPGNGTQAISQRWVRRHCGFEIPTLIAPTSAAKGQLAQGLALTHFIDDRPENISAVAMAEPRCYSYLYKRTWNANSLSMALELESLGNLMEG